MTKGETLAYNRGYGRAMRRAADRVRRALQIGRAYKQAAEINAPNLTAGRCMHCERWTRGCPTCFWGYCRADFEPSAGEGSMWADVGGGLTDKVRIATHETFGCINWIERQSHG